MNNDCIEYEILISAAIDGELEQNEFVELEAHVDQCESCREQYRRFEVVTDMLDRADNSASNLPVGGKRLVETSRRELAPSETALTDDSIRNLVNGLVSQESSIASPVRLNGSRSNGAKINGKLNGGKQRPDDRNGRGLGRHFLAGGLLAATAAGVAALLTPDGVDEVLPKAPAALADVSIPAEEASSSMAKSWVIQDSQTRAIQQELRTMRLLAETMDLDSEDSRLILAKIESLTKRAERLNSPLTP